MVGNSACRFRYECRVNGWNLVVSMSYHTKSVSTIHLLQTTTAAYRLNADLRPPAPSLSARTRFASCGPASAASAYPRALAPPVSTRSLSTIDPIATSILGCLCTYHRSNPDLHRPHVPRIPQPNVVLECISNPVFNHTVQEVRHRPISAIIPICAMNVRDKTVREVREPMI